jgi:hypothetical protein
MQRSTALVETEECPDKVVSDSPQHASIGDGDVNATATDELLRHAQLVIRSPPNAPITGFGGTTTP